MCLLILDLKSSEMSEALEEAMVNEGTTDVEDIIHYLVDIDCI